MKTIKKIIASFCVFAIAFTLFLPVVASADPSVSSGGNFFQWVTQDIPLARAVIGKLYTGVCSSAQSPDGKHHSTNLPTVNPDRTSNAPYVCTCDYCGQNFTVTADDISAAYDSYVNSLPAQGYSSDGSFYWYPTVDDIVNSSGGNIACWYITQPVYASYDGDFSGTFLDLFGTYHSNSFNRDFISALNADRRSWTHVQDFSNSVPGYSEVGWCVAPQLKAPVTGWYTRLASSCARANVFCSNSQFTLTVDYTGKERSFYPQNNTIPVDQVKRSTPNNPVIVNIVYSMPVYLVEPVESFTSDLYNVNTRAGTVCGDLAVMGDNNTLTRVTTTIVNETTNNFYNPGTGETLPISDWTYNYIDRSYDLTLENGENVRVIYGNDNVSLVEGGNTYTYYYYITNNNGGDGGGSGSGGSGSGGSGMATGTDLWDGIGDSLGSILLVPLRIIKAVLVKLIGWLTDLADTIGEDLEELVTKILGWFDHLPELMSGFLAFLTAIFPFIPEDVLLLFSFGMAAVVFIAIIRALRRR